MNPVDGISIIVRLGDGSYPVSFLRSGQTEKDMRRPNSGTSHRCRDITYLRPSDSLDAAGGRQSLGIQYEKKGIMTLEIIEQAHEATPWLALQ